VKVARQAYRWLPVGVALLFVLGGLLVVCLKLGPATGTQQLQLRTERAALLQQRVELEGERTQVTSQFNEMQRALLTERAARLELEKILANVQLELGRTQDQLAFFEDLLPPGPQGALAIRAVDIVPHAEGLHYRVLLMRGGKAIMPFVGALQFIAKGYCRLAGVATEQTIVLQPLLASPEPLNATGPGAQRQCAEKQQAEGQPLALQHTESQQAKTPPPRVGQSEAQQAEKPPLRAGHTEAQQAALRLEFVQFQRGQGLLAIPSGFAPRFVTVRVLEGGIVLASKVVAL
jgi:hypothetical protein